MAAKMLLVQPIVYADNSKNDFKFSGKSRDTPDFKSQDKNTVPYLDDFACALVEENAENFDASQKPTGEAVSRLGSSERSGKMRNGKLEMRYRTNSTDSAFSEESFADFDSDESTKLESLIDQLIFTDDRHNPDISIYTKPEKLPSGDSSILDVGDLFSNTDIFTVDFESLTHDAHAPNFLERELRPDAENTESTSSISSTDSGKCSMDKYPTKMSAFLDCNLDNVLNNSDNSTEKFAKFSPNLFPSSDEDEVIDCGASIVTDNITSGTQISNGCANDCVHESSFVDLSTLLDVTPYGSPFSVGPVVSERRLSADDDNSVCTNKSNSINTDCSDTSEYDKTTLKVPSTTIKIAEIDIVTNKVNDKNENSEKNILLTEGHLWPMKENQKTAASLPPVKNSPTQSMDISEANLDKILDEKADNTDEKSHGSLCLYSLENLCGYGDQEMLEIKENNDDFDILIEKYNYRQGRFGFKNTSQTNDCTGRRRFLKNKCPEMSLSNQTNVKQDINDPKDFNGAKLTNINSSFIPFSNKYNTVKINSYFLDSEFSKDIDDINVDKSQPISSDKWILPNENHVKGLVAKDHSYRAQIPENTKGTNMSVSDKEKNKRTYRVTNTEMRHTPAKRPLAEDLNSIKKELPTPEGKSPESACFSMYAEFPGLKYLLEGESFSVTEPPLSQMSRNNYTFCQADNFGVVQRKVPKFSVIANDETCVPSTILYQTNEIGQNSPSASFSSYLPAKAKVNDHHYSQPTNVRDVEIPYMRKIRQGTGSKHGPSMQTKDETSEMKELEKYLRGIIPTENYDAQEEIFFDHQRENINSIFRQGGSPCSFLKKLLTGELTAQMYRKIDQQFCENELLMKNEMKME